MQFYVSVPFSELSERLDPVLSEGFSPEVRMTRTDFLGSISEKELDELSGRIQQSGAGVFTHGPFFGLDIASMDGYISEFSLDCLRKGVEVTAALGGDIMVIHTGYSPFFSRGGRRHWFRNWAGRAGPLIEKAEEAGVTVALENTWDDRPEILLRLRELCRSEMVRFCLDTGHVNCFSSVPLKRWWEAVGEDTVVLHLHDNRGDSDDHMVPGMGTFDFEELASYVRAADRKPKLDLEIALRDAPGAREYLRKMLERD
jgi:sugar phosphate isomerase/epimerase